MDNKTTKNFCLGIDLGTTNSVLRWALIDPRSRIIPTTAAATAATAVTGTAVLTALGVGGAGLGAGYCFGSSRKS